MKQHLIALSSLALLAASAGAAWATAPEAPAPAPRSLEQEKVSGTVRGAKEDSFTLLTEEGNSFTIQTNGQTKYMKDGQEAARGDVITDGAQVTVHHEGRVASKVSMRTR